MDRTRRRDSSRDALAAQGERVMELLRDIGRRHSLRDPLAASLGEAPGITPPQLHALMWIRDDQPLTMGVLARRLGITEKTVTGIVDRLEEANVARRERDPQDRRVVHVVLTPEGEKVANRCRDHFHERVQYLLALIDADDRDALFRILEKIKDRIASNEAERTVSEGK